VSKLVNTFDFDVVVIGGGIHGVGVAQAAAAAGYTTALIEQKHLAYGTSRYSSKLIHGGLRYLENFVLFQYTKIQHVDHGLWA